MLDITRIIKIDIFDIKEKLIASSDMFTVSGVVINDICYDMIILKGKLLRVLSNEETASVVFHMINGDRIKCDSSVSLCTDFQINVILGDKYIELKERRRYYKIKADIEAYITNLFKNDDEIEIEKPINVTIKDINIGGVYVLIGSNYNIAPFDVFALNINFEGEPLSILAKSLRKEFYDEKQNGYGCCFINTSFKQEEVIARFIQKQQQENMDKIKRAINARTTI